MRVHKKGNWPGPKMNRSKLSKRGKKKRSKKQKKKPSSGKPPRQEGAG